MDALCRIRAVLVAGVAALRGRSAAAAQRSALSEPPALLRLPAAGIVAAALVGIMLLARAGLPVVGAMLLQVPALLFAWCRYGARTESEE